MEPLEGRYYAFHFDDVSAAVNYCGQLVPHLVSRLRVGESDAIEQPAIWLHVPTKTIDPRGGCDLLMTRGAILAALAGAMPTPQISPATRTALPAGAVLVLGEDSRHAPIDPSIRRRASGLDAPLRITQRSA